MTKCLKCGGTGITFEGKVCEDCGGIVEKSTLTCLFVPEQYRGLRLDTTLVSKDVGEGYALYLKKLQNEILSSRIKYQNIFIGSPANHSKTVLAFTTIEELFRRNIDVFPLLDLNELRSILQDIDKGKTTNETLTNTTINPLVIYTAPYMFISVPSDFNYYAQDAMLTIMDRRVRRGLTTIFLYNGSWSSMVYSDSRGVIKNRLGDGSFGTIANKSFWIPKKD